MASVATCVITAHAQSFPSKPVTLVVPVAPGGILDAVARMIGPDMSKDLGQPVVVDNKPGASGNIGAAFVAKSAPDGYTLLVGYSMFQVGNPAMFRDLAWDPLRDFASVAMVAVSPHVVAVHPSVPAHTLRELVDLARASPGKLNYASPGSGSVPHVGMELFKQQEHIDIVHVPYKGAGPMIQDVVAGVVQVTVATPASLLGFVQSGRVRALAVAAKERHPLLPDVPTTVEAGYPDFQLEAWIAAGVAAGMMSPYQLSEFTFGYLSSTVLGTSGSVSARFALVTASARSLPLRMCGSSTGTSKIPICTWPPTRSVTAGAAPL